MPKSKTPRQPKPLYRIKPPKPVNHELVHATPIEAAHFALREDGSIAVERREEKRAPTLTYSDPARSLWLYHGNCFELLDAIAAKYPEGRFDCIFADPPYFLSNGGITCHAGKMVKVDIERCLLASTSEGDIVLDPFLGGGTTAVACVRNKRGCVGIEMDEAHANLCVRRIKAESEKGEGELFK